MRIHTDELNATRIRHALERAKHSGGVSGNVDFAKLTAHSSTKRMRAFEVQLVASKARGGAPPWAQWGCFIAHLYAADPQAIVGPYDDKSDFQKKTDQEAIREGLKPFRARVSA